MSQKRERAVPRQRTALTQNTKSLTSFETTLTAPDDLRQEPIDIVVLLAARSGVAAATVRAHLIAFGMEARS